MSQVVVDIVSNDQLTKTAESASRALKQLAAQEAVVKAVGNKLGVSYQQAAKGINAAESASAKLAAQQQNEWSKSRSETKKAANERKKTIREVAAIAAGFVAAGLAATALGFAIASSAKDAGQAKAGATALAGAWTGGDGPRTIRLLDNLAQALGEKFGEVRKQFVEFRQAGLDNTMAGRLIKLRADLVAVGLSAEEADKQIGPVLAAKGAKAQANAFGQIAKAFGVVGDGALAAGSASQRLEAGLSRLDNVKTKALELIWNNIKTHIGEAANNLARVLGEFLASDSGAKAIAGISDAFDLVTDSINRSTDALSNNKSTAGSSISTLAGLAASVIAGLIHPIDSLGETLALAGRGAVRLATMIGQAFADTGSFLASLAVEFFNAGVSLVSGLIDGIASRAGAAADSARELASGIATKFKTALGIHSPSVVFAGYGENVVRGFEQGQERALPEVMPLERAALAQPAGDRGSAGAATSNVTINLTVQAPQGVDTRDWALSIRAEIQRVLSSGTLSRGFS